MRRPACASQSLASIAEAAHCARSTVAEAVKSLEAAGLLSWVDRLIRRREHDAAAHCWRIRVLRTSNGYRFNDPRPAKALEIPSVASKSDYPTGTKDQDISLRRRNPPRALPLEIALARLREGGSRGS